MLPVSPSPPLPSENQLRLVIGMFSAISFTSRNKGVDKKENRSDYFIRCNVFQSF